jgi:hypothetical protein
MNFVLVNGRMPARQNYCFWCCTPIYTGYVRDIVTRLCYCDHQCYTLCRENSALLLDGRVCAS